MGTENVRAPRGNKNRGIKFEKTEQLLPFGKLRLTECDLIFSTRASERTSDNCVLGAELDKITGCLPTYSSKQHARLFCSGFPESV